MEVLKNGLAIINGDGKDGANIFLTGMAGAAQGVTVCAQTGVFIPWQGYILCVAAGAATNIIWPH
ncbi:TPA: bacteriocin [Streptococcus pyogenes]|uniref:bacteriocin n=1 Tax=Streptococcus pyogenes TaxID=1314 RepID=UPI0015735629|nr:bacteriocin [Streptococcus pyogenes]HEP1684037.1 bacteriocin [Streptococcus pyogenes]HEP1694107.1 bacteriocin [Streptococcus pyogenes]HEP1707611.1 bacteriocin [Streptococcus pyogenes]HEP1709860.1 bacteriocin [Streptococcus pyogenes]